MHPQLSWAAARQMDLVHYLGFLGYYPQKIRGSDYWYLSPLREERTASFKVNRSLNLWYDHGIGKGGTLIDFGMLYFHCSAGELLRKLTWNYAAPVSVSPTAPPVKESNGKIKIVAVGDLTSEALKRYLCARKIDENLAARYCRQVRFVLYGKEHVAIGFPNNSGGFELRNEYFKGSSSPKDITLVDQNKSRVSVFEGFFSFLSYLQLGGGSQRKATNFLVLNSLSLMQRATSLLDRHRQVHLYLDRDDAGVNATRIALATHLRYQDRSALYRQHKDLNEFLVQGGKFTTPALRPRKRC